MTGFNAFINMDAAHRRSMSESAGSLDRGEAMLRANVDSGERPALRVEVGGVGLGRSRIFPEIAGILAIRDRSHQKVGACRA